MEQRNTHPGTAIVNAFLMILGITLLHSVRLVALIAGAGLFLVLVRRKHHRLTVIRLATLLPVLLLLTFPLLLAEGWPPGPESRQAAALLAMRMLASALILIWLIAGRSGEELMEGVRVLRMPPVMMNILFLSFRYFMMVRQDIEKGWQALKSRGAGRLTVTGLLPVMGDWIGGFFLKSMDHSEKVYQAMKARGFGESIPGGEAPQLCVKQIRTPALIGVTVTLLILMERGLLS